MLIPNVDYFIRYVELPYHIGGGTIVNDDGTYDIYINSRLPLDKQWKAFLHELGHILDDHFFRSDMSDADMERAADNYLKTVEHLPLEVLERFPEQTQRAVHE